MLQPPIDPEPLSQLWSEQRIQEALASGEMRKGYVLTGWDIDISEGTHLVTVTAEKAL